MSSQACAASPRGATVRRGASRHAYRSSVPGVATPRRYLVPRTLQAARRTSAAGVHRSTGGSRVVGRSVAWGGRAGRPRRCARAGCPVRMSGLPQAGDPGLLVVSRSNCQSSQRTVRAMSTDRRKFCCERAKGGFGVATFVVYPDNTAPRRRRPQGAPAARGSRPGPRPPEMPGARSPCARSHPGRGRGRQAAAPARAPRGAVVHRLVRSTSARERAALNASGASRFTSCPARGTTTSAVSGAVSR